MLMKGISYSPATRLHFFFLLFLLFVPCPLFFFHCLLNSQCGRLEALLVSVHLTLHLFPFPTL
ncbi:hypothetical protein K450DRAFT_240791 [Umbelopsis ramanniana AG]|uniref:Uncharacterized protein n=1 Tax=Umbelopsis ramanniana AG TaxID=1314678 RepID=A0AAD5HE39_UMBRA|nr:uncharacterized protein K450DRAFT_240791 [Umbelopsis ramanniana AG]KAI8579644.1 hypothetical protein K450DRAFT_240791 [Umbelopsis ramanniana AG]